ncbi:GDSL-type esterase/lipase family protein [Pontiellaceae bacterium B12219]|nr:GDSL-type esterase/lipase family protein [Pontiellaceae bacterium B12219]
MKKTVLKFVLLVGAACAGGASGSTDLGAIWFVGDSITQSNADKDRSSSPRKSLYDLLTAKGYTFSYTGHHTKNTDGLPTTGSTVADNLYHYHSGLSGHRIGEVGVVEEDTRVIAPNLTTYWTSGRLAVVKPDIILIMLGTNDVNYQDGASERLRKLIQNILDLPDVGDPSIYVASIAPNGRNNSNEEFVIPFNAEIPGIVADYQAAGKKVYFVDHYTALNADYDTYMMPDNLHPSPAGNDVMGQCWFNAITNHCVE